MNVTNGTSIALGHHDFAMQDTSGNIHYDRSPRNDSRVGTHQSVHNISQVLLHPVKEEQGVMRELTLALDLYYTPGIIAIGELFTPDSNECYESLEVPFRTSFRP